mmetsp:Transcript_30164/g.86382  ORF Transcript_30164/g.86382 Transcript_30164/m.86382 type:complete len:312 (-) Transcript_30164:108-1043(-)
MAEGAAKSDDYTKEMKAKMGSSLIYTHEAGINYSQPLHRIILGSCLQTAADVDTLKKEGVGIIFCLQEDKDLAHFNIDIASIQQRAAEVGISHVRSPIRDFDPLSLRRHLPAAVTCLAAEMAARPDQLVYIHCTAGLGRAPGTALAYLFWVQGLCLDKVYQDLFKLRRCHPQIGMIRAATCDLLADSEAALVPTRIAMTRLGATKVEIAGLDVGWHNRAALEKDPASDEFATVRPLLPGTYQYKFIVDEEWMPCMELPTVDDNGNVNNVATVTPLPGSPDAERYARIMAEGGKPTEEEWRQLKAKLLPQGA